MSLRSRRTATAPGASHRRRRRGALSMRQTLETGASYVAGAVGVIAALFVMLMFSGELEHVESVVLTDPWVRVAFGVLGALMLLGLSVHYVRQHRRRAALLAVVGSGVVVVAGLVLILK